MKKSLFLGVALLIGTMLLSSCTPSVPKADYDKALSDLSTSQAKVQSLEANVSNATAQIQSIQTELNTAKTQVQSLQTDNQAAQNKIKQAKLRIEILSALFLPVFKGQQMTASQQIDLFFTMRDKVKETGDSQLISKFQAILDSAAAGSQTVQQATAAFYVYLLETMPKTLENSTF